MRWEDLVNIGWEKCIDPRTGRRFYLRPLDKGKRTKVVRKSQLKAEESCLKDILFPMRGFKVSSYKNKTKGL